MFVAVLTEASVAVGLIYGGRAPLLAFDRGVKVVGIGLLTGFVLARQSGDIIRLCRVACAVEFEIRQQFLLVRGTFILCGAFDVGYMSNLFLGKHAARVLQIAQSLPVKIRRLIGAGGRRFDLGSLSLVLLAAGRFDCGELPHQCVAFTARFSQRSKAFLLFGIKISADAAVELVADDVNGGPDVVIGMN